MTSGVSLAVVHASADIRQGLRPELVKFAACRARRDRFAFTARVVPRVSRVLGFARVRTVAVPASCVEASAALLHGSVRDDHPRADRRMAAGGSAASRGQHRFINPRIKTGSVMLEAV